VAYEYASPEHRLYDAASRWFPGPGGDPRQLIEAATQCLVEGLDSPTLRVLAGTDPGERSTDVKDLLDATLAELEIPRPGDLPGWEQVVAGGRTLSRAPTDTIRVEVRAVPEPVGGHELLVHVNDVEMTRRGAGLGMDPFDVLIPDNRLVATSTPARVPIARCDCGTYGCASTDVTIVRQDEVVHWEWREETPLDHGVTFPAQHYDDEVARIAADHGWERPEDTTARLVLTGVDREALAAHGLRVSWAARDHADRGRFKVALFAGDDDFRSSDAGYQVFLRFRLAGRTPVDVASAVLDELARSPRKWRASWYSIKPGVRTAPAMAGLRWRRERIG